VVGDLRFEIQQQPDTDVSSLGNEYARVVPVFDGKNTLNYNYVSTLDRNGIWESEDRIEGGAGGAGAGCGAGGGRGERGPR
jgi:hypothetical protein